MIDKSPSQTVPLKNIIRKTASFLLKAYKQFTQTLNMEILTMLYFTQGYKKKITVACSASLQKQV